MAKQGSPKINEANESGWYREAHALAPVTGRELFCFRPDRKGGGRLESDLVDLTRQKQDPNIENSDRPRPDAGRPRDRMEEL